MMPIPVKRGRGRPKGSGTKKTAATATPTTTTRKSKVQIRIEQVAIDDDQQVSHLSFKEALHNQEPQLTELEQRLHDIDDSWETESLFEDIIEDLSDDTAFKDDPEACTPEEAMRYRQLLRSQGPAEFMKLTVLNDSITAKRLLTAFGVRPPPFLEGADDDQYYSLLTLAITRELNKRARLLSYNSVDDAVSLIQGAKNIIVLTGAGISTSLGIPDFRSAQTGLYTQLANLGLPINDPQEVFDIEVFRQDPTIFYTVAKDILPTTKKFTPTHAFIAMLQAKGKLLTNYSQNIDNIEANAGISHEKLLQCHGSFAKATCQKCGYKVPGETIFADIKASRIPRCDRCITSLRANGTSKRKRGKKRSSSGRRSRYNSDDTDEDDDFDIPEAGIMKPDITFFRENLPDEFHDRLRRDMTRVDLVIVIGTSLKVSPVSEVVPSLPPHVPAIYISRTPVGHIDFDIDLLGDCDVVVAELARRAGWNLDHEMIPPAQKVHTAIIDGQVHRHSFTTTNTTTTTADDLKSATPTKPVLTFRDGQSRVRGYNG
ncbi:NAD-dependent histone deacetylase sir2 [Neopestalotiopsis sp. 37M]|nr:NAD-dependent histone deacetylase sir2 [Neopestalotiopsis sp. 37M]